MYTEQGSPIPFLVTAHCIHSKLKADIEVTATTHDSL